jgi:hypothetical protein
MALLLWTTACGGTQQKGPPPLPAVSSTIAAAAQACADEPLGATGTIYYACDCGPNADPNCKPGDDSNAGTDPLKPWRTYQKGQGQFANLNAGDTLAFCKGGSFTGNTNAWVNANCKAGNTCTVRDYAPPGSSGNELPPKLVGATMSLANPGKALHEEGYRFLNLEFDGDGTTDCVLIYNDIKDVLLCNLVIAGYQTAINVSGSNPPANASSDGLNANITLRGSRILNNSSFGWVGGCSGGVAEYNYFDHNGAADPLDHSIYFGAALDSNNKIYTAIGMRATGNELYHSAQGSGTTCTGVPLVSHGLQDGLIIQANTVMQDLGTAGPGCWGIGVVPGYPTLPEGFTNVTIAGNRVINAGDASIVIASCQKCVIEDNLVIQGQPGFGSQGIVAYPDGTQAADDLPLDAAQVLNNTIYFAAADAQSTGIVVGGQGSNHVIAANAVLSSSSSTSGWSCLDFDLPVTAYYSDHNLCWDAVDPKGDWEFGSGPLAAWQMKSGLDMHSLNQDPMFKNAALTGYDFSAAPGSPLIGAGDPTHGSSIDIDGMMRSSPPDIGAYQH